MRFRPFERMGIALLVGVLAAAAAAAVACTSVLGIGDRTLDPGLDGIDGAPPGPEGGSSSSGGSTSGSSSGSSSGGSSGSTSGSSSGTSGSSGSSSGSGDGGTCADPCTLASGLNHPILIASDDKRVYWTEWGDDQGTPNGSVKSCPVTGCGAGPLVYARAQMNPDGIVVDAQNVYWGTSSYGGVTGGIWSCPIAGCIGTPTHLTDADTPTGLTIDGTYVYWVDYYGNSVVRVVKTGGKASVLFDGDGGAVSSPNFCAVDSSFVYLTDASGTVYRVPLTGGQPLTVAPYAGGLSGTWGIAIDTSNVYYGLPGQILSAPKTATDGGVPIISTVATPDDLFVEPSSGMVYWSDWGSGSANDGTVGRVGIDGGGANVLAASLVTPNAVTVSGNSVLWLSYGTLNPDGGTALASTGALLRSTK